MQAKSLGSVVAAATFNSSRTYLAVLNEVASGNVSARTLASLDFSQAQATLDESRSFADHLKLGPGSNALVTNGRVFQYENTSLPSKYDIGLIEVIHLLYYLYII